MKKKVSLAAITVLLSAVPASWSEEKVTICHLPPGNSTNIQIITVGSSAVQHHMVNHGDYFPVGGVCVNSGSSLGPE